MTLSTRPPKRMRVPSGEYIGSMFWPTPLVGSCCSLLKYSRQVYSDDVDLKVVKAVSSPYATHVRYAITK